MIGRSATAIALCLVLCLTRGPVEATGELYQCRTSPDIGQCLIDLVRASRTEGEKTSQMDSRHLALAESAVAAASLLAPGDATALARLHFEVALAAQLTGATDGVAAKYEQVCAQSSGATASPKASGPWCAMAGLKVAMMGTDADAVADSAKAVLRSLVGGSEVPPEDVVSRLARGAAPPDARMLGAEALADLAVARYESDRKYALSAIDAAFDVLATADAPALDVTVAAHVVSAALIVVPQPWDSDAKEFNAIPSVRRALKIAELAFGDDNSRIWEALAQLQFHVWTSRFELMSSALDKPRPPEDQRQTDLEDWNPMSQRPLAVITAQPPSHPDNSATATVDEENKRLIDRLYKLALRETNESKQEHRLEELATSVGSVDGLEELQREILMTRARLIEQAFALNRLPVALKYQATVLLAKFDLTDHTRRDDAVMTIDTLSKELVRLDDEAEQLGRALLAVIGARIRLIQIDESTRAVELPKAADLLARARAIADKFQPQSGISEVDLLDLSRSVDELRKK